MSNDVQQCTGCGNTGWQRVLVSAEQRQFDDLLCAACIKKYDSVAEILYHHQEQLAALTSEIAELRKRPIGRSCSCGEEG